MSAEGSARRADVIASFERKAVVREKPADRQLFLNLHYEYNLPVGHGLGASAPSANNPVSFIRAFD